MWWLQPIRKVNWNYLSIDYIVRNKKGYWPWSKSSWHNDFSSFVFASVFDICDNSMIISPSFSCLIKIIFKWHSYPSDDICVEFLFYLLFFCPPSFLSLSLSSAHLIILQNLLSLFIHVFSSDVVRNFLHISLSLINENSNCINHNRCQQRAARNEERNQNRILKWSDRRTLAARSPQGFDAVIVPLSLYLQISIYLSVYISM